MPQAVAAICLTSAAAALGLTYLLQRRLRAAEARCAGEAAAADQELGFDGAVVCGKRAGGEERKEAGGERQGRTEQ